MRSAGAANRLRLLAFPAIALDERDALTRQAVGLVVLTAVVGCAIAALSTMRVPPRLGTAHMPVIDQPASRPKVRLAVLGNSDSHSYQDSVWYKPSTAERGGAYRDITLQWTEALAKLRGDQIDPGDWGVWGSGRTLAYLRHWIGLDAGSPKKQDYRYNVAFAGAGCADLTTGGRAQAPHIVALMDLEPQRWRDGVVVIRIGINDLGSASVLGELALNPTAPAALQAIATCVRQVGAAVGLIRERHPLTRIVLVGILNNADWPPYLDRWQSHGELANITAGLDVFDRALKQLAAVDSRIAFFDDRAWFAQRWGSRGPDGRPTYKTVSIGQLATVVHAAGDHPSHSVLADGHAGLVWNALWAQSLVQLLRSAFGMEITPIADDDVAQLVRARLTSKP